MNEIRRSKQQQRHALGVFGEDRKVESLLILYPRDA